MRDYKTENRKGAIALGYNNKKDDAPKIIAKGFGEVSEKMLKIARENNIMIQDDRLLFESLFKLEVGADIPVKMYQVIAGLLAYVYKINNKYKRGYND